MPQKAGAGSGGGNSNSNSNITSFFKPMQRPQTPPQLPPHPPSRPHSQTPRSSRSRASKHSSPLPSSLPPSEVNTPAKRADRVIGASDEDDSDGGYSDDSLEDLSLLLGRGRSNNNSNLQEPSLPVHNPYATPRAKRTAVAGFHSSPLAIMSKHKFDLKALAKDARQDNATNESSLRVRAAADIAEEEEGEDATDSAAFVDVVNEKSGPQAQKVLRAVQRTEPGQSELRYCFFNQDYHVPSSSPVPKKASKGPWRLLTHGTEKARDQHLASGLPQTILQMNGGLPDELFDWILDELCIQKSALMRQEYSNLITNCPEQVGRLLTAPRLEQLFLRLGASDEPKPPGSKLDLSKQGEEPYKGRDWSCLRSFIELLGLVSRDLSVPAVISAAQTLLRMALDKFLLCSMDVLTDFGDAIQQLVHAIPRASWDNFCFETCSSLYGNVKAQCIRINTILCLPVSDPRVHDLRRRLAVTFLFRDHELSRHASEDIVTLRGITDCLSGDDFVIRPKTDFAELRASIILLDIAVHDGAVATFDDPEDEKKFNEEVDELAARLREVWRKINDSGMKLARTEAKSVVEWVQQRLSHSVRTRRKAKKSIFDLPGQADDPFLPRQQDYMKKFLAKKPKSPLVEDDAVVVAGG